jgi:multidrug efflux pump subunit AcrA (membrane-fusion protein)
MKSLNLLAASGFALSAFLMAPPAMAQQNSYPSSSSTTASGDRVDANGMPTTHSTPAEQSQTADLNDQAASAAQQSNTQADSNDAQYQAQQQQYQQQLQQNEEAQRDYQNQRQAYEDQTAQYENLRARFAAERAAYHRDLWPADYRAWELRPDYAVMHARVEITNGDHVGTVTGLARDRDGRIEGLEVSLDNGKMVWIDAADARFNRTDGVLMTDLDRTDLRQMADERF